jgi:hypothetical protein
MQAFLNLVLWILVIAMTVSLPVLVMLAIKEVRSIPPKHSQTKPKIDVDKPLR